MRNLRQPLILTGVLGEHRRWDLASHLENHGDKAMPAFHRGVVIPAISAQTGEDKVIGGRSWVAFRDKHEWIKHLHSLACLCDDENLLVGMATNQRKRKFFQLQLNMVKLSKWAGDTNNISCWSEQGCTGLAVQKGCWSHHHKPVINSELFEKRYYWCNRSSNASFWLSFQRL